MFDSDTLAALAILGTIQLLVVCGLATRVVTAVLRRRAMERAYRLRLAAWNVMAGDTGGSR